MAANWKKFPMAGGIIALLALVPLFVTRTDIITTLFLALLFITLAQSWNIIGGYAGQINLGHAAFFGSGALMTRFLWLLGVPLPFALVAGGAAAALLALIIGVPAFRLRGVYFVLGTLALAEILRITVENTITGVSSLPVEYLRSYDLAARYYLAFALAVVTVAAAYVLKNSKFGIGVTAIREDEETAEASGVNTLKYKLLALVISAFFAGLAGGTFAFWHVGFYYHYPFAPLWTFEAVIIAFIGGVGTVSGPIIGALFYVIVREVVAVTLPGEVHLLVFGALFVGVVLLFPRGLVGLLGKARRLLAPTT